MYYSFLNDYIALSTLSKGSTWRVRRLRCHLTDEPISLAV